jgi:multiple sugar transport system substrate-binding protein
MIYPGGEEMNWKKFRILLIALVLVLASCTTPSTGTTGGTTPVAATGAATAPGGSSAANATSIPSTGKQVTLTVWDYYGDATPIKPLIEPFQKANPDIKINYQSLDWDTTLEKMNVVLTGGDAPDVATVDMTWLPRFAALGAFKDLKPLMNGQLNGKPLNEVYTQGALDAITFNDQIVAALYDFDTYALYYRSDLFEQKGLQAPKNWDELKAVAKKLVEGDKYRYEFDADTFHGSQWIYENGGNLLSADNKQVVFNSPEAVEAITFNQSLLKDGVAINWTTDQGERIQGVKDGRIAMFSDGPYYMGIMKSAAPEMAGKWKVALHPFSKQPGSYLGGTGLVIPAKAKNQDAAWKFIQFAMLPENQIGVYKYAGAAPATNDALNSPEVNAPDPYFGNEKAFSVFLETMKTAHHFPYVRSWADIDTAFTEAMQKVALEQASVKDALDEAAKTSQEALDKP